MSQINQKFATRPATNGAWKTILWTIATFGIAASLLMPLSGLPAVLVTLLVTIPFSLLHCARRYGGGLLIWFFILTWIISNFFENLSIVTGFPFGHYHYTGTFKILAVPAMIGPIYFGLGYICWLTASTILDRADMHLDWRQGFPGKLNTFVLPLLAAATMTMFDVGSDSLASTVGKAWIWENGGGVFGVPYTNYLGWCFVTYLFFQAFALRLAFLQSRSGPRLVSDGGDLLLPAILIYGSLGVGSVSTFIAGQGGAVRDMTGVVWNLAHLNETMMTINLFGVVIFAFLAVVKIARGDLSQN